MFLIDPINSVNWFRHRFYQHFLCAEKKESRNRSNDFLRNESVSWMPAGNDSRFQRSSRTFDESRRVLELRRALDRERTFRTASGYISRYAWDPNRFYRSTSAFNPIPSVCDSKRRCSIQYATILCRIGWWGNRVHAKRCWTHDVIG